MLCVIHGMGETTVMIGEYAARVVCILPALMPYCILHTIIRQDHYYVPFEIHGSATLDVYNESNRTPLSWLDERLTT